MPLGTRTVNIALEEQTPKAETLRIIPALTGADDELLLEKEYKVKTNDAGVGSINLPVRLSGTITYKYEIPKRGGNLSKGQFNLEAGGSIGLEDLILGSPPSAAGNWHPAFTISYGDATPAILFTPASNKIVTEVVMIVEVAFNGTGAKISIGTDAAPESILADEDSDLSVLSTWGNVPGVTVAGGTPVKAFITPGAGASQGRVKILIEYAPA